MRGARSRNGITTGGWLTIRYRPSTRSASFDSACRLSRVCAFRACFSAVFAAVLPTFLLPARSTARAASLIPLMSSCSDKRAYQTSKVRISANSAICVRYAATDASVAARASDRLKPLLRAAIVKLAAIRFTSYSNGPGSVSSKSFRSNSSVRSGDANTPKFERCASPHSWTFNPAVGVSLRSVAMIFAAPR